MRKLDRTHKGYLAFRPLDDTARSGAFVLLKDSQDHEHCGRWCTREQAFVYGSGQRIVREIVSYCARRSVGELAETMQ